MTTARALLSVASLAVLVGSGCGEPPVALPDAARLDAAAGCQDPDHDTISSADERSYDVDGDGRPDLDVDGDRVTNDLDDDSDGDGTSDAMEAGDTDCSSRPRDLDLDGVPDFLDLDANGDGVPDAMEMGDTDHDGTPDSLDLDVDGDGIANRLECGTGARCADTDGDGTPDVLDLDSDADTISDRDEGAGDPDLDMIPSFRDTDSDGDTVLDASEAGDTDLATPAVECPNEIDPTMVALPSPAIALDGLPDYVDADSDNDGLGDGDERRVGTDPCAIDTDHDGTGDLAEGAYVSTPGVCPDGMTGNHCACAHDASCGIPPEDFYVILPYHGGPVVRDLDFGTTIRVADVFFISDTTGSMGPTIDNVKATVTAPVTGILDRVVASIPDVWVGGGGHRDVPFASYSSVPDEPFYLSIRMTPPDHAADVRTAFETLRAAGGGDSPEAGTFALYEIMTGAGGTWSAAGQTYTMRHYVGDCLDTGWGAPCFRDGALPIVIHFSDICQHNGPADDCDDYVGIHPATPSWTDAMTEMSGHGARYVGINASSGSSCATVHEPAHCATMSRCNATPCWFMRQAARQTGSVDLDGNELVYDLPNLGTDRATFSDTIVGAVSTIATRVPLDIATRVRGDSTDPERIDERSFIASRSPACNEHIEPCWTEPAGTSHAAAVLTYDMSTFFAVVPGTRVLFRITFRNDIFPGESHATLFRAHIDVTAGSSAVLDTRDVYIVVPALPGTFG